MSDPSTSVAESEKAALIRGSAFDSVQEALRTQGPLTALARLAAHLEATGDLRALLDALLLRARYELGLPLVSSGSLAEITEPIRTQYEEKYIEALRLVGSKYLVTGDIPSAWAYFRAIGETDLIARAIRDYRPSEDDERLGAVIEVAFNHGVNPLRGFELILEQYGTCSAITAFEQLSAHDEAVRRTCAGRLIERLHADLSSNLRSDLANRGQLLPGTPANIAELIAGRDWLFADDAYHVDISHLASVVRMSVLLDDPALLALAADLTEYGRRLSPRLQFEGHPPFERIFDDHAIYLAALLDRNVDAAVTHFRSKLSSYDRQSGEAAIAAQTLVNLLVRLNRLDAAIELASDYLAGTPDGSLFCPGVAQLCQRAGDPQKLAAIARDHHDLVNYTAALLMLARG
jgi:hypothetical protein